MHRWQVRLLKMYCPIFVVLARELKTHFQAGFNRQAIRKSENKPNEVMSL